jgi:hypothetical protein
MNAARSWFDWDCCWNDNRNREFAQGLGLATLDGSVLESSPRDFRNRGVRLTHLRSLTSCHWPMASSRKMAEMQPSPIGTISASKNPCRSGERKVAMSAVAATHPASMNIRIKIDLRSSFRNLSLLSWARIRRLSCSLTSSMTCSFCSSTQF